MMNPTFFKSLLSTLAMVCIMCQAKQKRDYLFIMVLIRGGGQGGRPLPPPRPLTSPLPPPCLPPAFWSGARFARATFSSFPLPPPAPSFPSSLPLFSLLPPPLLPPPSPSSPPSLLPCPPPLIRDQSSLSCSKV